MKNKTDTLKNKGHVPKPLNLPPKTRTYLHCHSPRNDCKQVVCIVDYAM